MPSATAYLERGLSPIADQFRVEADRRAVGHEGVVHLSHEPRIELRRFHATSQHDGHALRLAQTLSNRLSDPLRLKTAVTMFARGVEHLGVRSTPLTRIRALRADNKFRYPRNDHLVRHVLVSMSPQLLGQARGAERDPVDPAR